MRRSVVNPEMNVNNNSGCQSYKIIAIFVGTHSSIAGGGGGGWNAIRYQILDPPPPPKKIKYQTPQNIKYHALEKIRYLALKNQISNPQKKSIIRYHTP